MARDLNDRRVPHRDPAHVIDRHRLLVVGQRIRRHAIHGTQRAIQADHYAGQRLVAQRHHHPKPAPGKPRAQHHRAHPGDLGPVAVVPLQPQPRLRDPRPRPASMPVPPPPLGLSDRPARRPIRPRIPHRHQHPMHHISPHQRARPIHLFIDLGRERVDQRPLTRPLRQPATRHVTRGNQPRHRLVIAPRQRRRCPQRPRRVRRLKDLHRFLAFLHRRPPRVALTTTHIPVPASQDSRHGGFATHGKVKSGLRQAMARPRRRIPRSPCADADLVHGALEPEGQSGVGAFAGTPDCCLEHALQTRL